MNGTVFRQSCIEVVDELIEQNQEWRSFLTRTAYELNEGIVYPRSYVRAIGQNFGEVDIYDAWSFLQVHHMIHSGDIAVLSVDISREPFKNEFHDEMNRSLKLLPYPFSAKFMPCSHGDDGGFFVDMPVHAQVRGSGGGGYVVVDVSGQYIPLEVGTTSFQKTYMRFKDGGVGLARWPYGDKRVTVFLNLSYVRDLMRVGFSRGVYGSFLTFPDTFNDWNAEVSS